MNARTSKRICWLAAGLVMSLGSAPMAMADDTELFIANADPQVTGALPNIMFIIDTSGSMTNEVLTQEDWDPNLTFSDCYRSDALYFSTSGTTPGCGSNNWIRKTSNRCAAMLPDLATFGRYDDNFLAWRNRNGTRNDRWVNFDVSRNGRRNRPIECQADYGVHGSGGANTFTADGTPGPWAPSAVSAPAWNQDYAIWDGNWLNWWRGDGTVATTRIDVVKEVATTLVNNIDGVNVGLMRFSRNSGSTDDGGPVIQEMVRVENNRQSLSDTIDALPADGWTPLSETLFEAGQYFAGRSVILGNEGAPVSVAGSRTGGTLTSNTYDSPMNFQCQKNYAVLLTDGAPTRDTAADSMIEGLPGFDAVNTTGGSCDGSGHGACLDDMAEYMYKADMNGDLNGIQNVITYTIGFTVDLPLLASTAARGGGEYRLADDTSSLANVLTEIVSSILDEATTFTAPAVPVNAFNRTQNLRDVYVSVFEPTGRSHWPGNLKKYRIQNGILVGQDGKPAVNPETGFFWNDGGNEAFSFWSDAPDGDRVIDGGAAFEQPIWDQRPVYSNITDDKNLVLKSNMKNRIAIGNAELDVDDFGMDNDSEIVVDGLGLGLSEFDKVIAWTLGMDVVGLEDDPAGGPDQRNAMGDPLHVRPVAVIYGGTEADPDSVIYTATNDGMMHAVDGKTGEELWGFVPERLLPRLAELYADPQVANKRYGLDGDIRPYIVNNDGLPGVSGSEQVFLVFGMRRGGDGLFAMEVTDRNNPRLAWAVDSDSSGLDDLGQTWSTPSIAKVNIDGDVTDVVIIGGGYDDGQDNPGYRTDAVGNAIYMLNLKDGNVVWSAGADGSHDLVLDGDDGTAPMEHSIPAPVKVVDLSGDGIADRMYAGDMGGRLWRFDIINGEKDDDLVEGGLLATLGAADIVNPTAADVRRFYAAPDVVSVLDIEGSYLAINIGSGYRASPLETATNDEFYSVRDFSFLDVIKRDEYPEPVTRDELVNVTTFSNDAYPVLDPLDKGWRITMVESAGEKILTESISFNGVTFFTSFSPGNPGNVCETAAGSNRVYRVSVRTGAPIPPDDPYEPWIEEPKERIKQLKQGGIAPEVILLFPGDEEPTACSGVECFDPGFSADVTRTYWFQDETQ